MTQPTLLATRTWPIAVQAVAVALVAYVGAGAAEIGLFRVFSPTESELAWVSDVLLSTALGVAVYLWRHLGATRRTLADRERAELVLRTQFEVAADLQRRLLPALPPADGTVEWAASLRSAGMIGGDFYDIVARPGTRHWMLLVADVSGKGIPAAMALSTLRASFRALASQELGPGAVLSQLSSALHEQWSGIPYVTAIIVQVDVEAGTLRYANAAHPAALIAGQGRLRALEALGPPAAMFAGMTYEERRVAIAPGDVCVIVTDGVTEALGDDASDGIEALMRTGETAPGIAGDVCDSVMAAAMRAPGPEGVADWDDDRTVVVMAVLDDAYEHVPVARAVVAVSGAAS